MDIEIKTPTVEVKINNFDDKRFNIINKKLQKFIEEMELYVNG